MRKFFYALPLLGMPGNVLFAIAASFLFVANANAQLSGTYKVGSGQTYTTLTAAISALNTSGVSGPVTFLLTNSSYTTSSGETFPIVINQISGASSSKRITIKPDASVKPTISGSSASGAALIKLNGADYITIDGSNTWGGTSRDLTISNTSTSSSTAAIWVASLGTGAGAKQDSIKNVNIAAGSNTVTSTFGIYAAGTTISTTTTTSTGANNDTLVIDNNSFTKAYHAIHVKGATTTGLVNGLVIKNNSIGSSTSSDYISFRGIWILNTNAPLITQNTIFNISISTTVSIAAIEFGTNNANAVVSLNTIKGIYSLSSGGYGAWGINVNTTTGNTGITIVNNMISDLLNVNADATSTQFNPFGIRLTGGTGYKIYYNSVSLATPQTSGTTGKISAALIITSSTVTADIRNNVFSNTMNGVSGAKSYAVYVSSSLSSSTFNYNDYYVSGTYGILGYYGSAKTTLSDWQTATGQDANSLNSDPKFISSTDLHLDVSTTPLNAKAVPISGITTDFDGNTRSSTKPDIGADEVSAPGNNLSVSSLVSPGAGQCSGTYNLIVTINNAGGNDVDSFYVNYYENGTLKTAGKYTSSIAEGNSISLNIGSITTSSALKTLKIFVYNPNGQSDPDKSNDTLNVSIKSALSGTYSIGSGKTYQNFTEAVNDLKQWGLCGAVTFEVENGTYTEQISIPAITGSSSSNTITFISKSGDNSKVILTYPSSSSLANNYVLFLDGADYVTIKNLTLSRTLTNTYGRVIEFANGANYNQIIGNKLNGIVTTSTTSSPAVIYSSSSIDNYNTIKNNEIRRGSYGIYFFGSSSSSLEKGNIFEGNSVDSSSYYAFDIEYQDSAQIIENTVTNAFYSSAIGMQLRYFYNASSVQRNIINVPNGYKGLHTEYFNSTSSSTPTITIANNMISVGGTYSGARGYDIDYSKNLKVYHNSVLMYNTNTSSSAAYLWSSTGSSYGSITLKNNSFVNTGGGLSFYISATAATLPYIDSSDYNNFYTTGATLANWGGTTASDISAYRTASGKDANSIAVNPLFESTDDLHARSVNLDNKGTPVPVVYDIDNQLRSSSTPDIGADEYDAANTEVAIENITPGIGSCSGTKNVDIVIRNLGKNQVDSLYITYVKNGSIVKTTKFTLSLASDQSTTLTIGTVNLGDSLHNIVAYVGKVNNVSNDEIQETDTIRINAQAAMAGTYAIGSGKTYQNFTEAVSDMKLRSICGAVTFEVENGTYTEQVSIPAITGSSSSNTITFISKSGDNSKVILTYPSSSSSGDNYALQLNGTDYVTIKKLTLQRSGTNTYGRVLELSNGATYNTITENNIVGVKSSSSSNERTNIYSSSSATDQYNVITKNTLKYGAYGMYIYGSSTTKERGLIIQTNSIDSFYSYGIYAYYQDSATISNNTITNSTYTSGYGMNLYYFEDRPVVANNMVDMPLGLYGINLNYMKGTSSAPAYVYNNMVSVGGSSTSANAVEIYYSQYLKFLHNSLNLYGTGSTARALLLNSPSTGAYGNITLKNNNIVNTGGGYAVEINSNSVTIGYIDSSDYNNFYTTGSALAKWGGTVTNAISDWRTASGKDANSISVNPKFESNTNLHVRSVSGLDAKGTPVPVSIDIDNDIRNSSTPDIGADEFTPVANDLKILSIIYPGSYICADSSVSIGIVFINEGTASQSSFNVGAKITGPSGTTTLSQINSVSVASEAVDTIFITGINAYAGGLYNIKGYTALSGDGNNSNDTSTVSINVLTYPSAPVANDVERCGPGAVNLTASVGTGNVYAWYNDSTTTNALAFNSSYEVILSTSDTFFVQSFAAKPASAGPKTSTGSSTYNIFPNETDFTVVKDLVIDSIGVYPGSAGTVIVEILNSTSQVIATVSSTVNGSYLEYIPFNISLKAGNYKIRRKSSGNTANLLRNSTGAVYPYTSDALNITGTSNAGYFYYFYDWRYRYASCEGPRVAVKATVHPVPVGASLAQGSVFNGVYGSGTISSPDTVCPGKTISYQINPPTGYSNSSYGTNWLFSYNFKTAYGNIAGDTSHTAPSTTNGVITLTPSMVMSDSTGILTVTVTDAVTGCDSSFSRYIHILPAPKIAFAADNICGVGTVSFTNNTTVSSGTLNYLWYFGDGDTSTAINPSHSYSATGSYNVKLIVENSNGCKDSLTQTVKVFDVPVAAFNAVSSSCEGYNVSFVDQSTIASGSIANYLWNFGDGTTSTAANPTKAFSAAGIYAVKLVIESNNGCKDSVSTSITINEVPKSLALSKGSPYNGVYNTGTSGDPDIVCALYKLTYDIEAPTGFNNADYGSTWEISSISFKTANGTNAADTNVVLPSASGKGQFVFTPAFNTADSTFKLDLTIKNKSTGCEATVTRYISVLSAPDADFSNTNACIGNAVVFTDKSKIGGGTGTYKWYFGDGSTSTATSPTHYYSAAGTYTASLVVLVGSGCSDSIAKTVTVYPKPTPDFTYIARCQDTSIQFTNTTSIATGTISSYKWYFGDGNTSTSGNPSHAYAAAGTYTVSLVALSAAGCSDSISKTVTVYPKPAPAFSFTNRCLDSTVSFTNSSTISSGSIVGYMWKFGDGSTSTSTSPTYTYANAGTYTVTLIATSNNGCKDSAKKTLTVYPKPAVNFSASNQCLVNNVSFTNSTTVSSGTISSYLWKFGDGTTSTNTSPAKKYSAAGTYTVTLIATTNNGCVDSVKKTVAIYPMPAANYTFTNRCLDSSISFTSTSTIASGSITSYSWSFGNGNSSTSQNPTHVYSAAGTYQVKLVVTSNNGCKDSVTKAVTVYPKPKVNFTAANQCVYNSVSFTNSTTVTSGTISSYFWKFGDGRTSTSANPTNTYGAAGTYTVTLVAFTNNGCKDSVMKTVTIYPKPAALFTFVNHCQDSSIDFVNTSSVSSGSISSYEWKFGDGNTSTSQSPSYTYSGPGTYQVTLTVTTNNGCKDSVKQNVTVYPKATAIFSAAAVCVYEPMSFKDLSTIATGYNIAAYDWSFGDGGTSADQNPAHKYAAAGKYTVTLTVTTNKGCQSAYSTSVTVNAVPQTSFSTADVCNGNTVMFNNTTTTPNQGGIIYNWSFGDGKTSTLRSPSHTYAAPGEYEVRLVVGNNTGCTDTAIHRVNVFTKPVASFSSGKACVGNKTMFTNASTIAGTDSIVSYSWNFGDGQTSASKDPDHIYNASGKYFVQLIVTSNHGCTDTVENQVVVYNVPQVAFKFNSVCDGEAVTFQSLIGSASFDYKWNFGDGNTAVSENTTYTYAAPGTYNVTLTITNANGCASSLSQQVIVKPRPVAGFEVADACMSQAAVFTNTSTVAGDSVATYNWNFGDGKTSADKAPVHKYTSAGTFNVSLIVTTYGGCSDTFTKSLIIHPQPVADFTSTTVCEGDATVFTNSSTVSTGNIAAYSWNFGDGNTSADTSPSHTYAIAGTYQVKLVVSTNNGCTDSVTKTVTVNALPTLTVSHVTNERNVKFMVSDSSYTEYHWSFGDTKTSTDKNPMHRYADTGHYSVFVTVTNASGCSQTFTDTVHVYANAIAHEQPKQNFHMKLYPNPYKQKAVLEYSLKKRATVRAAVYDVQGREVEVIVDNVDQITGNYRYIIGTTKAIKAGVYFVRMTVDGSVTTQQLIRVE